MNSRLSRPVPGLYAVIPAAGRGDRLRTETGTRSKVFLELPTRLGPKSILSLTLHALSRSGLFEGLVVATSVDEEEATAKLTAEVGCPVEVVIGGETRQHSVFNCLERLRGKAQYVAIHDAARPFVTSRAIEQVVNAGLECGASVLVEPVSSTLKRVSEQGTVLATLPREEFALAQTPQVFHFKLILDAHAAALEERFSGTDDVQLVERFGGTVRAVPNASPNPKITTPTDLPLAQLLAAR